MIDILGYEVHEFVGSGSFGVVHGGKSMKTGEKVAIKVLDLDKQLRLSDVLSLEQEIRAMKVSNRPSHFF